MLELARGSSRLGQNLDDELEIQLLRQAALENAQAQAEAKTAALCVEIADLRIELRQPLVDMDRGKPIDLPALPSAMRSVN
ncbi:hypothetical protein I6F35_02855 [Bradyrhizobium sp. BRP22]|uniref:hypothetical protein n=1 Tax=Bradyrhizobium sp. BRP22 TaxID=2793821 RepID=UPI001CD7D7A9|nr:hypothetical protein [Bradyrhizobium sp. BRP22]MCA1452154.1 hypothetical protein [Bradyrhizobium sp. BRP22]